MGTFAAVSIGTVVFIVLFIYAIAAIRIVRPFEKGVVERLGKYQRTYDPGLHMIVPVVDRLQKVDMRESVVDIPPQEVITKDNVVVTVDAVVYYEATDPVKLLYNVANFYVAATKLAQTNLRNVVGEMALDESLTSREKINAALRQILDDATDKWGVRVVRVELQRIEPPQPVIEAMHRQMKAERDKRAMILEAEGDRQAAINRAEGAKQSAILEAEGRGQAIRQIADAEKYQRIEIAKGDAEATELVFAAIHNGDPTGDLLAVRYIDSLKSIANGQATKLFLPYEISGVLSAVASMAEAFKDTERATHSSAQSGAMPSDAAPPAGPSASPMGG